MSLFDLNRIVSDTKHIITECFIIDYINFINKDIFKAIEYYENNNIQSELTWIESIMNSISNNIDKYLSKIICVTNATKITRLGDMHCVKINVRFWLKMKWAN